MKSPTPNKADPAGQVTRMFDDLGSGPRKVLLAGLILFFLLAAATTLLVAYMVFQPQLAAFLQSPTIIPNPTAAPQCVQPSLTLGTNTYPLEVAALPAQGGLPSFSGSPGVALWVSNTFSPFVFLLEPATGSPDLQAALAPGDPMVVQWADCGREEFVYTSLEAGAVDAQTLLAQTTPGMAVIIEPRGGGIGYLLRGQRPELVNPPTPEPTVENALTVDITFGDTTISADGKTLTTRLTVTNRGNQSITITNNDLSLTSENQPPEAPLQVVPPLSQELQPAASLPLVITFPNPGGHTAVLRVLDITVDLYY